MTMHTVGKKWVVMTPVSSLTNFRGINVVKSTHKSIFNLMCPRHYLPCLISKSVFVKGCALDFSSSAVKLILLGTSLAALLSINRSGDMNCKEMVFYQVYNFKLHVLWCILRPHYKCKYNWQSNQPDWYFYICYFITPDYQASLFCYTFVVMMSIRLKWTNKQDLAGIGLGMWQAAYITNCLLLNHEWNEASLQ